VRTRTLWDRCCLVLGYFSCLVVFDHVTRDAAPTFDWPRDAENLLCGPQSAGMDRERRYATPAMVGMY